MKSSHAAVKLSRRDRFIQTNSGTATLLPPTPNGGLAESKYNNRAPRRDEKIIFIVYAFTNLYFRGKKTRLPLVMSPGEPAAQQPTGKNE